MHHYAAISGFPYKGPLLCKLHLPFRKRKKYLFRPFLLLFLLLFLSISSFANRPLPFLGVAEHRVTGMIDWHLDATVNAVEFYHAIVECGGSKVVFLKIINKNNYQVNVSWKEVFTTLEGTQVEGAQGQKKVMLATGEHLDTNCENITRKEFVVLPQQVHPTYVVTISNFEYKGIAVSKVI
jgi:hypothetical protein